MYFYRCRLASSRWSCPGPRMPEQAGQYNDRLSKSYVRHFTIKVSCVYTETFENSCCSLLHVYRRQGVMFSASHESRLTESQASALTSYLDPAPAGRLQLARPRATALLLFTQHLYPRRRSSPAYRVTVCASCHCATPTKDPERAAAEPDWTLPHACVFPIQLIFSTPTTPVKPLSTSPSRPKTAYH